MARFHVTERERTASAEVEYVVIDTEDGSKPVAEFSERQPAEAHAEKLNAGPLDWDEQENWKDEWDEEDDAW